ncbi:hypothetical protein Pcinc_000071 [Petrolisthes cinctipes]|uniref:Aftiphilin clathrin-binding box domain-containing protein n=1 Tax=Petrolisthes cinctipes TaxID=88211 RepID=A0AAE1GMY2_PETCI|nr:hypothetical protein Pcinc_000071 [Petrolisthes cinctipes]
MLVHIWLKLRKDDMAFQMIPPRLSSSPPPLDSLPSVTFPGEEDDEEFGNFSTHNSSFDITVAVTSASEASPCTTESRVSSFHHGLSDKLPKTPEQSPAKLAGVRVPASVPEDAQEDVNCQDSTAHLNCDQDVEEDFGDFQCISDSHEPSPTSDVLVGSEGNGYSDDDDVIEKQSEGQGVSNNSFTKTCTPPPLDRVAADEFTRFSPTLPVSTEDDFGDFAASEMQGTTIVSENEDGIINGSTTSGGQDIEVKQDRCVDGSITVNSNVEVSRTLKDEKPDGENEECTGGCVFVNDADSTSNVQDEVFGSAGDKCYDGDTVIAEPIESVVEQEGYSVISGENDNVKSECPNDGFDNCSENSGATEKKPWTGGKNIESSCKDVDNVSEDSLEKSTPLHCVQSASNDNSNVDVGNKVVTEERTADIEQEKQNDEFGDISKFDGDDEESDFGDFDRANDDDDLDFEDLRKKVEEGAFAEDDDFGDFTDNNTKAYEASDTFGELSAADGNLSESESGKNSEINNDDEDEFGDFTVQELKEGEAVSQDPECEKDDDDFGDFAGHESKDKGGTQDPELEDDDFGDFSQPGTEQDFVSSLASERQEAADADSWADSDLGTSTTSDPVLQKLEALVRKWVPGEVPAMPPSSPVPAAPPSLRQVVDSDAFVWRWLETKLESCPGLTVSWASTRAHASFLSALGVDARNILFGQKWSSSVPLFARTLSFSPLTPAKPGESSGGATVGPGSKEPTMPPLTLNPTHVKEDSTTEVVMGKDGASEEQIPPPKFDWTSSGLTNPLEGPGLEREFLNDGGEEGASGSHLSSRNPPAPSPLVQQILGGGGIGSGAGTGVGGGLSSGSRPAATPLTTLSSEVRQAVETLPDLSYMRSKVLMFPIRDHQ